MLFYSRNPAIRSGNKVARVSKTKKNYENNYEKLRTNYEKLQTTKIARDPRTGPCDLVCVHRLYPLDAVSCPGII